MFHLKKEVRDIKRFNRIILILGEEGFGYLFSRFRKKGLKEEDMPRRLVRAFEKLGPTFIKLGQILSLRPDMLPKEYIKAFGELQDKVPPFPYIEVEKIIKEDFGKPIGKLFQSFDKTPIASASISQVHKARLKNGKIVAVKVQRPNVRKLMEIDIEIMLYLAKLLASHSNHIAKIRPVAIIDEFKQWTERELDFSIEASNARRFYNNFKGSQTVKIPAVYDDYSGKRVLTMEFIDGMELHNLDLKKKGYNIKVILKNGFDSILTQVFIHGFFHADPHPGNILVLPKNKIAFVDFGIVGMFDDHLKKMCIELFYGIVEDDTDSIVNTFIDMGLVDEDQTDIDEFRKEILLVLGPLQASRLKDVTISHVLEEVLDIAFRHKVKMPVDFVLFGKAIVELEGIGLEYEPDFRFIDNAKPFLAKLIKSEFSIHNMAKEAKKSMVTYGKLFRDFPAQISSVLRKIQKGTIKLDVEDTDVKRLGVDIDRSSNRLTYGLIIAAFLITGALLVDVGNPVIQGFSVISLVCFIIALIFVLSLIVSIKGEVKK